MNSSQFKLKRMQIESGYYCAVCGEWNETMVDATAGEDQRYTEDCSVCCHPNSLHISIITDENGNAISANIQSAFEE